MARNEDEVSLTASRETINFHARGKVGIAAIVLIVAFIAIFISQYWPS